MAEYVRIKSPGNLEMGVGFDTRFESIPVERHRRCVMLWWCTVVICATLVTYLSVGALFFAYLATIGSFLFGAFLISSFFIYGRQVDVNWVLSCYATVFRTIFCVVVSISLPLALFIFDVGFLAYARNAFHPEVDVEVRAREAESKVMALLRIAALLVGVSLFVMAKFDLRHEAAHVMKIMFGVAFVIWIFASRRPNILLAVALYAADALKLAYAMWLILWQRRVVVTTVVMVNRTVVIATYKDPDIDRHIPVWTLEDNSVGLQSPNFARLEIFPKIL